VGALTVSILRDFSQGLDRPLTGEGQPPQESAVSNRELEALQLVAEGHSSKLIGQQLYILASTVGYHLTSIFNKLGVDTCAQAVAVASQLGIL
jgi:NarL family two-component system response regulator YdfI